MPRSKLPTPSRIRIPFSSLTNNSLISKDNKDTTCSKIDEQSTYIDIPPTPNSKAYKVLGADDSDIENEESFNIVAGSPNPLVGQDVEKEISNLDGPLINSTPKSAKKPKNDNLLNVPERQTRLRSVRKASGKNDEKLLEEKKIVDENKNKNIPSYMNNTAANKYKRVSQTLRIRKTSGAKQKSTSALISKPPTSKPRINMTGLSSRVKRQNTKSSFNSIPKSPKLKNKSPISHKIHKVNKKIKDSRRRLSIVMTKNNQSEVAEITSPLTNSRFPSGESSIPTTESWRKELKELKKTDAAFTWKKFDNKKQLSVYSKMLDRSDEKLNEILNLFQQTDYISQYESTVDGVSKLFQLTNKYKNDQIALDNEISSLQMEVENFTSENEKMASEIETIKEQNENFRTNVRNLESQTREDFIKIEKIKEDNDNLQLKYSKSQLEISSLEKELEKLKQESKIQLENQTKQLKIDYEEKFHDMERKKQREIKDLQDSNEQKLNDLTIKHNRETKNLKYQHSDEITSKEREFKDELEKQKYSNLSIINENNFIKDDAIKTKHKLNTTISELELQVTSLKTQLSCKDAKIQSLNCTIQTEATEYKKQIETKDLAMEEAKRNFNAEQNNIKYENENVKRKLENQICQQTENIDRLTTIKDKLQQSLEDLQKSTQKANEIAGQDSQAANKQIGILKSQLAAANSNTDYVIKNKDTVIKNLQENEARLEEKLSNFGVNIDNLNAQLTSVNRQSSIKNLEANQLETQLSSLKIKCENLEEGNKMYKDLAYKHDQRCRALNETVCQLKGTIRVMIRIRPLLGDKEKSSGMNHIRFSYDKSGRDQVTITNQRGIEHSVSVDKILQPSISQADVFNEVDSMIQSALDGHHVCIFAYGQTGSGKTFSMEGPENVDENSRGIIPRAMDMILTQSAQDSSWEYEFTANYIESYVEKVYDLLSQDNSRQRITVRVDSNSISFTPKLEKIKIRDMSDVNTVIKTAHKKRRTSCTNFNTRSSRSHSVFILNIVGKNKGTGKIVKCAVQLIDLAGSENAKDSGQSEGQGFLEAQAINKSLIALSQVINKVRSRASHVNFRDSELTKILMPSITESSKMLMMVHLNPCIDQVGQSIFSAKFAESTNITKIGKSKIKSEAINSTFS